METALEYLLRMHKSLNNNYRTPNGFFSESCLYIADEMSKKLILEGKRPTINWVGRIVEEGTVERPMIIPKRYGGKVKWACHLFAVSDNFVWDPLLDRPIDIECYVPLAFEKPCSDIRVWADYEEVLARVGKG